MDALTERARADRRIARAWFGAVVLYSTVLAVACRSLDHAAIELALRLQGRLSFALFVLQLTAPGVHVLTGWAAAAWLERYRDPLLRSFACSHLVHGAWILAFFARTPAVFAWDVVDVSGALAFPLILLLLLPLERLFGQRGALVRRGVVVYAWIQFLGFFVDRLRVGRPELKAWYAVAIVICIAVAFIATLTRKPEVSAS